MLFTAKLPFALEFISTNCCTWTSEPLCTNIVWAEKQLNWSSLNANGRQRLVNVTDTKKKSSDNANIMSFLTCQMQNWVDRLCYTKLHTLGDEQEQARAKKQSLKISINIPITGITERYSVEYSRHSIIDNTVLKIQLLEIQNLNSKPNCDASSSFSHFTIISSLLTLVTISTIK